MRIARSVAVITIHVLTMLSPAFCSTTALMQRINLKLLYAGRPDSERQQDFVAFLQRHFVHVQAGDLANISKKMAENYDIVILDYDLEKHPEPEFSKDYGVPTVTIGVAGAHIGHANRLKTGYL